MASTEFTVNPRLFRGAVENQIKKEFLANSKMAQIFRDNGLDDNEVWEAIKPAIPGVMLEMVGGLYAKAT